MLKLWSNSTLPSFHCHHEVIIDIVKTPLSITFLLQFIKIPWRTNIHGVCSSTDDILELHCPCKQWVNCLGLFGNGITRFLAVSIVGPLQDYPMTYLFTYESLTFLPNTQWSQEVDGTVGLRLEMEEPNGIKQVYFDSAPNVNACVQFV